MTNFLGGEGVDDKDTQPTNQTNNEELRSKLVISARWRPLPCSKLTGQLDTHGLWRYLRHMHVITVFSPWLSALLPSYYGCCCRAVGECNVFLELPTLQSECVFNRDMLRRRVKSKLMTMSSDVTRRLCIVCTKATDSADIVHIPTRPSHFV
jgi:hypothetical protein